jgi:transposase
MGLMTGRSSVTCPFLGDRAICGIALGAINAWSVRSHPTTTQRLDWRESNSPHSMMYDDHLLLQLINSTVEDVSIKEDVGYDCVLGVLERRIDTCVDWGQYTELGVVGMDEISLKKGHRNYVVIITARLAEGRTAILAVLPDRQKDTVIEFLRSIPERLKQSIHTVCCDMYEGFTEAVREELPWARIVIDRFHVARAYREGLDELRKQELRRLKAELTAIAQSSATRASVFRTTWLLHTCCERPV